MGHLLCVRQAACVREPCLRGPWFWILLNCSCTTDLVDVCDPTATPKRFSCCPCALILGIVRFVLCGRDAAPCFAVSSGSAFEYKTFAIDWVQVPSIGDEAVRYVQILVSNCDTFCNGLLVVVLGLVVLLLCSALSADAASRSSCELGWTRHRLGVKFELALTCSFGKFGCFAPQAPKCGAYDICHVAVFGSGLSMRSLRRLQGFPSFGGPVSPGLKQVATWFVELVCPWRTEMFSPTWYLFR